jgi:pSer/pThr/pTyr-binding forkhead associated (FHA) protein/peroxiredoxin
MPEFPPGQQPVAGIGRLLATNPTELNAREFLLLKAKVTVGSDESNDFVIRDATVSRQHAIISFNQGRLEISDLKSTNGTFINGKRITETTPFDKGDSIRFGGTQFVFLRTQPTPVVPSPVTAPAATEQRTTSGRSTRPAKPGRRFSRRTMAELILVAFVLGFGAAQYLAYLVYHEQNKLLLAEAVPLPRKQAQPAPAPSQAEKSAPATSPTVTPNFAEAEAPRKPAPSPPKAPAPDAEALHTAVSLAQLVRGSGRHAGQLARDFVLLDLQGKSVSLSNFRGKLVLLNFWATWCGACRSEMPSLENLYRNLRQDSRFVVLTVSVDQQGSSAVQPFLQQSGYDFPVLLDQNGQVSSEYDVSGIPATYIIDGAGEVVWDCAGSLDWSNTELRSAIQKLLSVG